MKAKFLFNFLCALLIFYTSIINAHPPSSAMFVELVIHEDAEGIREFFSKMAKDSPTICECKTFIKEVSTELSLFYNVPLSKFSLKNLTKQLETCIKSTKPAKKSLQTSTLPFLNLYKSGFSLLMPATYPINSYSDEDFSTNTVIGLVEMLVGSLLYIIPHPATKIIGGIILADGIARAGGGLIEIDDKNKKIARESNDFILIRIGK